MMSSLPEGSWSTKLLHLITPESDGLWHIPSLLSHSDLMLIISSHKPTESQYWKMALWASFLHNLLCCPLSLPQSQVGWVYLPAEYRIKDWVLVTSPSFFLLFGGELPTEGLHSALLLHKLGSWRAECALGGVGPAPGQCYLCLAGEIGLIRGPICLPI